MRSDSESSRRRASRLIMAAGLGGMGVAHLVARPAFEALVPDWVPGSAAFWNYAATAAELGTAALLVRKDTAKAGGYAALGTFAVVWVANLHHAVSGGVPGLPGFLGTPTAAWLRAPLQLPLLWWAWQIAHPGTSRQVTTKIP